MGSDGRDDLGTSILSVSAEEDDKGTALLATAVVIIEIDGQESQPMRALCDTGAQANIIDNEIVKKMRWPTRKCSFSISGVGGNFKNMLNRRVIGRLKSRFNEILFSIDLVVAESGLSMWLPNTTLAEDTFPQEIRRDLAHPTANIPGPINILLGAGIWALIMKEGAFTNAVGMAFSAVKFRLVDLWRRIK